MKIFKKLISTLMVAALCILLPDISAMTASAEEPVTYYVKYLASTDQWRYMPGSTWNDTGSHRDLYYMHEALKDGDSIIIDGSKPDFTLKVSVRLKNLTLIHGAQAVVTANGFDECYVLRDSVGAFNGDVTNAYVYDNGRCTFNNNVNTLTVQTASSYTNNTRLHATVTVNGTVGHLIGKDSTQLHYEHYNFAAGKLVITEGNVKTDAADYSNTPSASSRPTQSTSSSSDEYDDVPKTGESNLILWLFGISAFCFAGRYVLKRTA